MTEPRIRAIRQVTECVDHRVIRGHHLLVGQIVHNHMGNQLERLAGNRPTESPVPFKFSQKHLIVPLRTLGWLLWQRHQKLCQRWITFSGVDIKVQSVQ